MGVRFLLSLAPLTTFIEPQGHPKLRFQSVTAGTTHTCGVTATAAYCWGDNGYGQLGTGNEHPSAVPVAVAGGKTFASVSAGDGFTCGVTTSGEGYCWGRSVYTQSHGGRPPRIDTPAPVSGTLHFVQVSAGANHACGVTTDRAVYCWGANALGQLGASRLGSWAPVPLQLGHRLVAVSAGGLHTCADVRQHRSRQLLGSES